MTRGDGVAEVSLEDALSANRRSMLSYAYTCTKDFELAQNLVSEANELATAQLAERNPADDDFSDWLLAIVGNCWESHRNTIAKAPSNRPLLGEAAGILFFAANYDDDNRPSGEIIQEALNKLSTSDQRLLTLVLSKGCTYEQAAKQSGITHGKAKVRLNKALTTLRDELFSRADDLA